ncbi:MAG: bifunctional ADP-dependent NAD(P)H-hydrate dehydratase/NAD(P)H-hydrate epimerase, partial [Firmicutes bacterium]|nr:bifunctional ADP-dependent NAD(P)H-hydrate dehydratase/NAD(P)H-hydrate epimerase [Candidatus Caballimonas caccae]
MERILTVEQMKENDRFTIEQLGVNKEELIERAGIAVTEEIIKRFPGGRVLVCLGNGNNGEDGRVIAKYLSKRHGFTVATINVFRGFYKMFDRKFDIIVDCIFGTGLNREVTGKQKEAIENINKSGAFIISCDIPSGLNGNTGLVMGTAVKANLTIAIQEYKLGHFLNNGPDYTGQIICKDIGISVWGEDYVNRVSEKEVAKFFEKRNRNVNKGNFGKVSIFGGSKDFPGSVLLSLNGLSALRVGTGYSNLAVPESLLPIYSCVVPECTMTGI